jgi:hypothetical protein
MGDSCRMRVVLPVSAAAPPLVVQSRMKKKVHKLKKAKD